MEERVPEIRFKGFNDTWQKSKLSSMCDMFTDGDWIEAQDQSDSGIRLIQTGNVGVTEYLDKPNHKKWISKDTFEALHCEEVFPGDILISRLPEPAGRACIVPELGAKMITAVDCTIVRPSNNISRDFLVQYLSSQQYFNEVNTCLAGGTRQRISRSNLANFDIPDPINKDEQQKIGMLLSRLDTFINLTQQKLDQLNIFKKACLEKMFPKEGETVPEVRFKGFEEKWKSFRFGDIVQIERGGSPRPIDEYITDSPNGLNWVKIGDAPALGRYITHTSEKIKPEGLSKTREVHPGDLILSNSMSFGKPYIMGIEGCIHDGWLLIRDTNNTFDLAFLCHLLSSQQMLEQFKALAAGSTVNNLNKDLVGNTLILFPKIQEQVLIGQYLEQMDTLITLIQQKLDHLKNLKKALLDKMFV